MARTLLLLALWLPLASAQQDDAIPRLPGARWTPIDPALIEGSAEAEDAGFALYGDVYTGSGEAWRSSPVALAYADLEHPESPTLGRVLDDISELLRRVRASRRLSAGAQGQAAANGELLGRHLAAELEVVRGRILALTAGAEALTWDQAKEFVTGEFQMGSGMGFVDTDERVSDSVYFVAQPTQVVLRIDTKPQLGRSQPLAYYATLDQAIEFRTVAAHMLAIFGQLVQPQLEQVAATLGRIDQGWTNYLEKGFSQYPWESYANGFLTDYSWSRPPVSQWVLLHPEAAILMDTRSSRSASLETALLVHGVGYLRYFDDADWFLGASATASITGDSAYGLGFGPTLHFGHTKMQSRVPHISLSVLWQDFETGGRKPVVAMTLDLWRLVDKGSEALYSSHLMR